MTKQLMLFKKWMIAPLFLVILFSCKKDTIENSPVIEKQFNLTGFTKIYSVNSFNLTISKGNNFQIKAIGPAVYVNDMELNVTNGNILEIQYDKYSNRQPVDVFITLPNFTQLNLSAGGKGEINGFANENHIIRTILSGASECKLNGAPANVLFDIAGGSKLDVTGNTLSLYGSLSGSGKLNAYGLQASEVDIEASGGSVAYVKAQDIIFAAATGGSRIYYKGEPPLKHFETSGGGQIIKE